MEPGYYNFKGATYEVADTKDGVTLYDIDKAVQVRLINGKKCSNLKLTDLFPHEKEAKEEEFRRLGSLDDACEVI
mgnify:CR=1 FL=1